MRYLVTASEGPSFSTTDEAVEVLEDIILPAFERLQELERCGHILGGGLPVGERSFVFIVEARSNDDVDRMLRQLPMWSSMDWEVTPLQTFAGRAEQERAYLDSIKESF